MNDELKRKVEVAVLKLATWIAHQPRDTRRTVCSEIEARATRLARSRTYGDLCAAAREEGP